MAWLKLDDGFADHPKLLEAGPAAGWLHVCGMLYCARMLTDGFVPAGQVRKLADMDGATDAAERLVAAGLWERADGGYQIHDYLEYNPSRAKVLAERAAAQQRMQRRRSDEPVERSEEVPTNIARTSDDVQLPRTPSPSRNPVTPVPEDPSPAVASATPRAGARVRAVPKPPRVYERNETWDAIAATCGGPATEDEEGDFGKTVKQLKAANATTEDIAAFALWWQAEHPDIRLTHRCYRRNWGAFKNAPPKPPPQLSDIKSASIRTLLSMKPEDFDDDRPDALPTQTPGPYGVHAAPRRLGAGDATPQRDVLPTAARSASGGLR